MADTFSYKGWESRTDDARETRIFECDRCGFEMGVVDRTCIAPRPPDWCARCRRMFALDRTAAEWIEGVINKAIERHKEAEKHCKSE